MAEKIIASWKLRVQHARSTSFMLIKEMFHVSD